MNELRKLLLPPPSSEYASQVDQLYLFLVLVAGFFFILIAVLVGYFVWRYRRRAPEERTPHLTHNFKLELLWSAIPTVIVLIIFIWGLHGYIAASVSPGEPLEIQVTARRWIWQFEYPDGTRVLNELHVPVGRKVRLVMSSEDVIHSFYVPAFRIKMDVLPGRYTEAWFAATTEGQYTLFCAEYCGRGHSDMMGKIYVESEEAFRKWLEQGDQTVQQMPLAELGAMLYESRGCSVCHSLDGTRREGPSFKGLYRSQVRLASGETVVADENYLRESILQPQAKLVAGYPAVMPTFQGLLNERELRALIEFIKAQQ